MLFAGESNIFIIFFKHSPCVIYEFQQLLINSEYLSSFVVKNQSYRILFLNKHKNKSSLDINGQAITWEI